MQPVRVRPREHPRTGPRGRGGPRVREPCRRHRAAQLAPPRHRNARSCHRHLTGHRPRRDRPAWRAAVCGLARWWAERCRADEPRCANTRYSERRSRSPHPPSFGTLRQSAGIFCKRPAVGISARRIAAVQAPQPGSGCAAWQESTTSTRSSAGPKHASPPSRLILPWRSPRSMPPM